METIVYRCGWCGTITDENGNPLNPEEIENLNPTEEQLNNATAVNGYCCIHMAQEANRMQVTRDMAIDAGDLSLEGEWI